MQNVTNYFLVNLSLADLIMSIFNTVFNFIFMKNRRVLLDIHVFCFLHAIKGGSAGGGELTRRTSKGKNRLPL